jgi:hypothetical protein
MINNGIGRQFNGILGNQARSIGGELIAKRKNLQKYSSCLKQATARMRSPTKGVKRAAGQLVLGRAFPIVNTGADSLFEHIWTFRSIQSANALQLRRQVRCGAHGSLPRTRELSERMTDWSFVCQAMKVFQWQYPAGLAEKAVANRKRQAGNAASQARAARNLTT